MMFDLRLRNFSLMVASPPMTAVDNILDDTAEANEMSGPSTSDGGLQRVNLGGLWAVCTRALSVALPVADSDCGPCLRALDRLKLWGIRLFEGELSLDKLLNQAEESELSLQVPILDSLAHIAVVLGLWALLRRTHRCYDFREDSMLSNMAREANESARTKLEACSREIRAAFAASGLMQRVLEDWPRSLMDDDLRERAHYSVSAKDIGFLSKLVDGLYDYLPIARWLRHEDVVEMESKQGAPLGISLAASNNHPFCRLGSTALEPNGIFPR